MYQLNDDYLLVGTESGTIEVHELWNSDQSTLKNTINSHPGSTHGVTVIQPLVNPSELITNERSGLSEKGSNFIVTAAGDQKAFKIWKVVGIELSMHITIETSLDHGIHHILQTDSAQFVCCDKTNLLKFYDFVDKAAIAEKEQTERENQAFADLVTAAFKECDKDNSGFLDIEEVKPMCNSLIKKFHSESSQDEQTMLKRMFDWLDQDGSGQVSYHEFKVQMMRSFIYKKLPEEILL